MKQNTINKSECPCGSGRSFQECCYEYVKILNRNEIPNESLLLSWIVRYSEPIKHTFMERGGSLIFRVSQYLDHVCDRYMSLGFPYKHCNQDLLDQAIKAIKNNILLTLLGSFSCLAHGLFLQSGSLIRCCIEDSMAFLEISENQKQRELFLKNRYSSVDVIKRIKPLIPQDIIRWYGHFSANFTHFGPLHSAPYTPRACYPDNYIIGSGLENTLFAIYVFHLVVERVHYSQVRASDLWKLNQDGLLIYVKNNCAWEYVSTLQDEIIATFPPDQQHNGFTYHSKIHYCK